MICEGYIMSLERLNEVDAIGIDNETGYVTLAIIDDLDWEDADNHLSLLQEKINVYLSFVESGEIYESYPEAIDRKVEIKIYAQHDLPNMAIDFIKTASKIISDAGFILKCEKTQ